jgi:hypothetical protein
MLSNRVYIRASSLVTLYRCVNSRAYLTMTCSSVQGKATMRHEILKGILRRAIHRAGDASNLEPTLHRLPGLETGAYGASGGTEAAGLEACGDILLALESGMSVVDVSITHPSGVTNRAAAATTDGAATARRDSEKGPARAEWVPLHSVLGGDLRLGEPAISFNYKVVKFLGQLGLEAKEAGRRVRKSGFVAGAIRELSVGLCRGNYQIIS